MTPLFLGLSGLTLSDNERALFRDADPAGYILFRRNCDTAAQLRALTDSLRDLAGREDLPILIDQEGGRVARLTAPEWPLFPPARRFGALYERAPLSAIEAARANAEAIARLLWGLGITVDCLPLLDVPVPDAHDIIGDRAYGEEPMRIAALGDATLKGLRAGGVVGVVKHIPGHGRACADSHVELPVVDVSAEELAVDLAPFRKLADAPMAMTAHVVYTAWDRERCASLSPVVIEDIIRRDVGFDGLLMSDDLGMHALGGPFATRATGVLAAGCDIALHCSGDFAEMSEIVAACPPIATKAAERLARAMAWAQPPAATDIAALVDIRDRLLAQVA